MSTVTIEWHEEVPNESTWVDSDPRLKLRTLQSELPQSHRKMRLVAAHFARWLESLPEYDDMQQAAELAEQVAEGEVTLEQAWGKLPTTEHGVWVIANLALERPDRPAVGVLKHLHFADNDERRSEKFERVQQLVACIIGNPFRPVAFDPSWRTSTVVGLAEAIYAERSFDRLPVLADALEEAGCDHPDVLAHCRGDGPHARRCWVVDLVLGKG